jgi:type IV secretory pathway VirB10-like protein
MGNSATNSLSRYLNAVPTITIRKGHPVVVYLPNDLLLSQYGTQSTKKGFPR